MALVKKFGIEIEAYLPAASRQGIFNTQTYIAVKIEAAGVPCVAEGYNHTTRNHWKVVSDGSVKNELGQTGGCFELVSPPMTDMVELEKVCEVLKRIGATANTTCGLHVHFDASGISADLCKKIIRRYADNENKIDAFMPASRKDPFFCRSVKMVADRSDRASNWEELRNNAFGGNRYYKVNVQSYQRHGTLEFRQHSGTVEFVKISNWVEFVWNFIKTTDASTSQPVTFLGSGKKRIIREILSDGQFHTLRELGERTNYTDREVVGAIAYLRRSREQFLTVREGNMVKAAQVAAVVTDASDVFAGLAESVKNYFAARIAKFAANRPVAAAA